MRKSDVLPNEVGIRTPLHARSSVAKILIVRVRKIEGEEDEAIGMPSDRILTRPEVRQAGLVLDNHFPIDHGRSTAQLLSVGDDARIAACPAIPIPRERLHLAIVHEEVTADPQRSLAVAWTIGR